MPREPAGWKPALLRISSALVSAVSFGNPDSMMMLRRHLANALVAIVLAGATFSCRPGASTATSPSGSASNRQVYQVKGVSKDLRPDRKKVTTAHEAIPDYMEPMTMDFGVKHARD